MSKLIKKKFKIKGMHCTSCALNIDFDLEDLTGVTEAKTNFAKEITEITYDEKQVGVTEITQTIKKTGYIANEE